MANHDTPLDYATAPIINGWLEGARRLPSPNFEPRPSTAIDLLVIHSISLPPAQFGGHYIDDLFLNRLDPAQHPYFGDIYQLRVSAHLLIDRLGRLTQYVSLDERAWHAGSSSYCGRDNCNDYSIGIELEGCDELPFSEAQYTVLDGVSRRLVEHYDGLTPERIVGHSDIAPGRKTDPGPLFDWDRYLKRLRA